MADGTCALGTILGCLKKNKAEAKAIRKCIHGFFHRDTQVSVKNVITIVALHLLLVGVVTTAPVASSTMYLLATIA
ncbi:unnamed protein product, partial [Iphiclides podalirius]